MKRYVNISGTIGDISIELGKEKEEDRVFY